MPAAAQVGDDKEAHFDAVVDRERRRLYGVAYSILRNHGEAEDALQETMVKAWKHWNAVRDESARRTWLTHICVNQCIDQRRKVSLRGFGRSARTGDEAPPDPRFGGRLVDLDASYRRLSVKQRAAIFLHYHHGYSIDECAGLMRCSAGSVRTHLARSIASMRKGMHDD